MGPERERPDASRHRDRHTRGPGVRSPTPARTTQDDRATRPPSTIFVTDTLTTIPDTVLVFVNVSDGVVTAEFLVATDELPTNGTTPTDDLLRPELHVGSDISDCDEGFEVSANGVQCDRARLGHLYAYAEASSTPSLGGAQSATRASTAKQMTSGASSARPIFTRRTLAAVIAVSEKTQNRSSQPSRNVSSAT